MKLINEVPPPCGEKVMYVWLDGPHGNNSDRIYLVVQKPGQSQKVAALICGDTEEIEVPYTGGAHRESLR